MTITSTAFQHEEAIPGTHSYSGGNTSPPLTFSEVPEQTESLLLVVEDPDAPNGVFTHWILYGIPPATLQIPEGELPMEAKQATNDFGNQQYDGPKPPAGTHHYHFKLFALDEDLPIMPSDKRNDVYKAMDDHLIEKAELVGLYSAQ